MLRFSQGNRRTVGRVVGGAVGPAPAGDLLPKRPLGERGQGRVTSRVGTPLCSAATSPALAGSEKRSGPNQPMFTTSSAGGRVLGSKARPASASSQTVTPYPRFWRISVSAAEVSAKGCQGSPNRAPPDTSRASVDVMLLAFLTSQHSRGAPNSRGGTRSIPWCAQASRLPDAQRRAITEAVRWSGGRRSKGQHDEPVLRHRG